MVDIDAWMDQLTGRLKEAFGPRLLFLGLQGSYGRGEAGPESDIDAVAVLDTVDLSDLDAYRAIAVQLPEGERACGFLCGAAELRSWPKYDLIQLKGDTKPWYGTLDGLLPPLTRADLARSAAIGAANLYHAACHTYLYGGRGSWEGFLKEARKGAFFILRALYEARTGRAVRTKRDLLPLLEGDERILLSYGAGERRDPPEAAFARLIRWSGAVLTEVQELTEKIP